MSAPAAPRSGAGIREEARLRWGSRVRPGPLEGGSGLSLACAPDLVPEVCELVANDGRAFGGLVVEEGTASWTLRYLFYGDGVPGWVEVRTEAGGSRRTYPSISASVHAADWHEREAEDLYGLVFEGHPRLGDFVLHDDEWEESVEPMRRTFDPSQSHRHRRHDPEWRPLRLVRAEGVFVQPVGPVFAGAHEPVQFLLESIGEDVLRAVPRLFFKYRGIEKGMAGMETSEAVLVAERFAATTAFSHALAFCRAVEAAWGVEVPARAARLRAALAELERLRHHVRAIQAICASTGLAVPSSQAAVVEEDLLRASGLVAGHRYLFGLVVPGGLSRDLDEVRLEAVVRVSALVGRRLEAIETGLMKTSSFLDRLEEVGTVGNDAAVEHGLVGPVARASGVDRDLRRDLPSAGYVPDSVSVPVLEEGDGLARLRVLFAEARQSVRLLAHLSGGLPSGPVLRRPGPARDGVGIGWAEAPRGASIVWIRLDQGGRVARCRLVPPSFANWHALHLATEGFAFQDFPIILASLGLSVAECDR